MTVHLARDGQPLAKHPIESLPSLVQSGEVLPTDVYWHSGMADWAPVATKWPAVAAAPVAPPAPAPLVAAAPAAEPPVVGNPFTAPLAAGATGPALDEIAKSDPAIIGGARWFWWIAGLSAVNTAMIHSGSDTSFVIGLGFTLIIDAVFQSMRVVAFAVDAVAIGTFVGLGWFAGRGRFWAFVTGMALYAVDALIYVPLQAWMSIAFHGLALFGLFRGAKALRVALRAAREGTAAPAAA